MEDVLLTSNKWRNDVVNDINLSTNLAKKNTKNISLSRKYGPLPNTRDILQDLSNEQAFLYQREVRTVVCDLQKKWNEVNEELKSLKNLIVNSDAKEARSNAKMIKEIDNTDRLMEKETIFLNDINSRLKVRLSEAIDMVKQLSDGRKELEDHISERKTTCQLLAQCLNNSHKFSTKTTKEAEPSLKALTPAIQQVLDRVSDDINSSKRLRNNLQQIITEANQFSKGAAKAVNDALGQGGSEAYNMACNLNSAIGLNRNAKNQASGWKREINFVYGHNRGPEKYTDLAVAEKLDRPIIKHYQKHPGKQLPEALELIRTDQVISATKNIADNSVMALNEMETKLKRNMKEKEHASKIDSAILRRRIQLAHQFHLA
ncbi:hypothetical protein SNEBB_011439 [Seison nebaliae]|nr:hypothetical protein SNEBB_011439 [Seison nebaliae]